jgi:hypothetical protein
VSDPVGDNLGLSVREVGDVLDGAMTYAASQAGQLDGGQGDVGGSEIRAVACGEGVASRRVGGGLVLADDSAGAFDGGQLRSRPKTGGLVGGSLGGRQS